jgi:hypothetical protein
MANVSKPKGLVPVGNLSGAPYNGQARIYYVPVGNATALYVGDPVTRLTADGDTNGIPSVAIGVAGSAICGVIVGVLPTYPGVSLVGTSIDLTRRSLAATTAGYVLVADDPNTLFEIQEGNGTAGATGTALTVSAIGNNANFVVVAGGATYADSGTVLDNATEATTATLNLKIMSLAQREDNAFGNYAKWIVKINNHQYGAHTGTAGV